MANPIKVKNNTTTGASPLASNLIVGELAVNSADSILFTKNSANSIVTIGKTMPSGAVVGTTDTQTLTNKTITAGVFSRSSEIITAITPVSNILTADLSSGTLFSVTGLANATTLNITNPTSLLSADGRSVTISVFSSGVATITGVITNVTVAGVTLTLNRWQNNSPPFANTGYLTGGEIYQVNLFRLATATYYALSTRILY